MGALQAVVEPRVLHDSEDLPQQHQADQHRSPDIDPGRQAAASTRCAPGIDDENAYRRREVHTRCSVRVDAELGASSSSPEVVASSVGASCAAKAPKATSMYPR